MDVKACILPWHSEAGFRDLLFQGDIRLSTQLLSEIVDDAKSRRKRTAFRDKRYPSTIWTNGVPYAFHRSLSEGQKNLLVYLLFTGHDEGCWSTVGRDAFQGQQIVSIGPGCEPFGITSHEVAHALGLFHEQSRYDRDYWITVYPNRIPRSQLYNFAKVSRREMALYGTPYDMGSVMQYTPFEFSIDPRVPSMIAVNPNEQSSMGQLAGPSYLDVDLLNRHYACLTRCPFPIECFNGGMQNPHNCRRCKCPSGYGGLYCGSLQAPTIPRCGRRIYARKEPRRMRVKIVAAPRATRPRTCVFHIVAPAYTRVYLEVEKVQGLCVPGCWRETAEFKVRMDKRITGNR
ncbi:unnamed protein product [Heligmosomoides polygyrus]|uniref:Zinc metalloproteinase n=1 Tax=Heligmosomoides polygyrus TaxID=6339 RepID=A0A183FUP6_HELPZ|nr:unnamed protein product [Heligmosomoides polygyrus]